MSHLPVCTKFARLSCLPLLVFLVVHGVGLSAVVSLLIIDVGTSLTGLQSRREY